MQRTRIARISTEAGAGLKIGRPDHERAQTAQASLRREAQLLEMLAPKASSGVSVEITNLYP
jgi:hypothetical protein